MLQLTLFPVFADESAEGSAFEQDVPTESVESSPVTADPLETRIDSVLTRIDENRLLLIPRIEKILGEYPDSDRDGKLRLFLADLYQEQTREDYQAAFDLYERGETEVEPVKDYSACIRLYRSLLESDDEPDDIDRIYYHLACSIAEEGESDEAVKLWTELGEKYPESDLAAESWMRVGEEYFDRYDFTPASNAYAKVLNYWDSIYFDKALYKLGWVSYLLDDFSGAIGYFIYLLDDAEFARRNIPADLQADSKLGLEQESLEYAALSFIEYGGVDAYLNFINKSEQGSYMPAVLEQMGTYYKKTGNFNTAIDVYNTHMEIYPYHRSGPGVQTAVINCYELLQNYPAGMANREELEKNYGVESEWADRNRDTRNSEEYLTGIAGELYTAAQFYHREAISSSDSGLYQRAADDYKKLIADYPSFEQGLDAQYALADCYFNIDMYDDARNSYTQVASNDNQGDSLRSLASLNAVVSAEHHFQSEQGGDSLSFLDLIKSCNYFITTFTDSPKVPFVRYKRGEQLFAAGKYALASDDFERVFNSGDPALRELAVRMLARSFYKDEDYSTAEQWFNKAAQLAEGETKSEMEDLALVTMYHQAENKAAEGDNLGAGRLYRRISDVQPDRIEASAALFEAAMSFRTEEVRLKAAGTAWNEESEEINAAATFEQVTECYSDSPYAAKALYNAALLREDREEYLLAAADYEKLNDSFPGHELSEDVLFYASVNLEKGGDEGRSLSSYEKCAESMKDPGKRLSSILWLAKHFFDSGNTSQTNSYVIRTYQLEKAHVEEDKELDPAALAEIYYLGAEITMARFKKIELIQPLDKNLRKKQELLNSLLSEYLAAAVKKVAPWALSSAFRMGEAFETFYNSLLDAELPAGLSHVETDIYIIELEEAAEPYLTKAIDAYASVCKQAAGLGLENEWTDKALARLEELEPNLFEASEILLATGGSEGQDDGSTGSEELTEDSGEAWDEDELASLAEGVDTLPATDVLDRLPDSGNETSAMADTWNDAEGSAAGGFIGNNESWFLYGGAGAGVAGAMFLVNGENGAGLPLAAVSLVSMSIWAYSKMTADGDLVETASRLDKSRDGNAQSTLIAGRRMSPEESVFIQKSDPAIRIGVLVRHGTPFLSFSSSFQGF